MKRSHAPASTVPLRETQGIEAARRLPAPRLLLFVVAADRTRKRDLQAAIKALATVDARPAGFALNMVAGGATDPYRYGYYRFDEESDKTRKGRRAKERKHAHYASRRSR